MSVAVFFFRPTLGGGTTTYTAHLMAALEAVNSHPRLYRVGEKPGVKAFGQYGYEIETVTLPEAMKIVKHQPSVLAAPGSMKFQVVPDLQMRMQKAGMRCVVHDPKEFSSYSGVPWQPPKFARPPICDRVTLQKFVPDAVNIVLPYARCPLAYAEVRRRMVSTARIHSSKRPAMLIEANASLAKNKRIEMLGTEYRMYSYGLAKKWPGVFAQKKGAFAYPMTFDAPVRLQADVLLNFDMSWFENDGGGAQYAQLEAMDAGAVPVMHDDWFRFKGTMSRSNILTVSSVQDIINMVRRPPGANVLRVFREENEKKLRLHDPIRIGKLYMKELNR